MKHISKNIYIKSSFIFPLSLFISLIIIIILFNLEIFISLIIIFILLFISAIWILFFINITYIYRLNDNQIIIDLTYKKNIKIIEIENIKGFINIEQVIKRGSNEINTFQKNISNYKEILFSPKRRLIKDYRNIILLVEIRDGKRIINRLCPQDKERFINDLKEHNIINIQNITQLN